MTLNENVKLYTYDMWFMSKLYDKVSGNSSVASIYNKPTIYNQNQNPTGTFLTLNPILMLIISLMMTLSLLYDFLSDY